MSMPKCKTHVQKKLEFVNHTLKFLKRVVLHVAHVAQGVGHGGIESEALGKKGCWLDDLIQGSQDIPRH